MKGCAHVLIANMFIMNYELKMNKWSITSSSVVFLTNCSSTCFQVVNYS